MSVPTAGELLGGFWAEGMPSGPMDAYALAAYLIGRNAAGLGVEAPFRGWQIRADERVSPGLDGRPTYGYPVPTPGGDPVWIAYDLVGGAVLASGPDFSISDGYVWFEVDPIRTATVRGHVWTDDGPVAVSYLLWSPGRLTTNTNTYPDSTYAALLQTIATVCDSPITGETVETVEAVWMGPDDQWRIITNLNAYRLPATDTPSVAATDVLRPHSPVGSAWQLHRLGLPYPNIDRVAVPPSLLPDSDVLHPIIFYNHSVSTVIDTSDLRTRLRFPVGAASSDDANAFWTAGHTWGINEGERTLAQALDTREDPQTEPNAVDLPSNVNPFEVVCRLVFNGAAYLLIVDEDKFGPDAETSASLRAKAYVAAAGPYTAVIEWTGGDQPESTEVVPA